MLLIILFIILFVAVCFKTIERNQHWKKKSKTYIKPWPLFGNMASNAFGKQTIAYLLEDMYAAYPTERYVGFYQYLQPTLLVRDPDLIKTITVKEIEVFPDHKVFSASSKDILANNSLFNLKSARGWHDMRTTLSPAFTSSKMRTIFILMDQCTDQFIGHFVKERKFITVELKDIYTKLTVDIISSTTFGVVCNSLKNPENEFSLMGKKLSTIGFLKRLKFFTFLISPSFVELLGISVVGKDVGDFFKKFVKDTIKIREVKQIVRLDLLHLLTEARKGRLKLENQEEVLDSGFAVVEESKIVRPHMRQKAALTEDDITAQVFNFFFAGFDTVSTLMSYVTYELVLNPEIQERLYEEVETTLNNCNRKITYEALLGMKYLDCVISETLRKWPPVLLMDRLSVKPFTIDAEKLGEKPLHLETDSVLWIPIYAIHRDPKYYPNPEKFDPERFNNENKRNIKPFTYLPFGSGPRNCIASRFALLEAKLVIVKLLQKFECIPVEATPVSIKLSIKSLTFLPANNIWIGLKPRTV